MGAARCQWIRPTGKQCNAYRRRGRPYCIHHDPERDSAITRARRNAAGAAATNEAAAKPDQHLAQEEVNVPETRAQVRELLARSIRDVLTGRITPQRGKVVQDLARQVLPLLPPDAPADPEERKLSDEQLAEQLGRELVALRARIEAKQSGSNGKPKPTPEAGATVIEETHVQVRE